MSQKTVFIVLSDGDQRAADLTRASIARQPGAVSYGVVRDPKEPGQGRDALMPAGDVRIERIPWWQSQHRTALAIARELPETSLVCMLRDGTVVSDEFQEAVTHELDSAPAKALLLGISRSRNINRLDRAELASPDPWSLLPADFEAGSDALKARYQRPSVLVFRLPAVAGLDFESFSSLADWYAYHRLFAATPDILRIEPTFPGLGYIGAKPDRRDPYEQGRAASQTLYQIAFAYPELSEDINRDFRTLLATQFRGLPSTRWKLHGSFLAGMAAAAREERARRRKLNRDIRELS